MFDFSENLMRVPKGRFSIQPMPDQPPKAIFLSYAREDAEAARRIADALRAFGMEVWFDMSELRGGDAWDQKIRRQIKDCALFMPVISDNSEQRGEGYFRLEWKLAVERTHLLAENMPFLFPVVIDHTGESSASVPEAFLKSQWTRLPGGEPTPQFIENVKRQMNAPRRSSGGSKPSTPAPIGTHPAEKSKSGFPMWAAALLGVAVLGLIAFVVLRPGAKPAPVVAAPVAVTKVEASAAPVVNDKSLAVLPFTNMSEEKDSAFFTDGIQEDVLTNLALISGLHVVSRTSVMQYRDTTKTIGQIAKELGVAYVLEGSVQRAGNKVRVTGQLIHAATDEHVWARAYDRDITDIFAIQEELATEIATALKTAITPEQKSIIAGRSTDNPVAYTDFLKARQMLLWQNLTRSTVPEMDRLLHEAVSLDPNFARAWVETAAEDFGIVETPSFSEDASRLEAGEAALAKAVSLAPDDPTVMRVQGLGAEMRLDATGARRFFERALEKSPEDAETVLALASLSDQERLWAEAMSYYRRAQALDPRNPVVLWGGYQALLNLRQFDQAADIVRQLLEIQPDSFSAKASLAILSFYAKGDRSQVDALLSNLAPEQQKSPEVVGLKFQWYYHGVGDAKAYLALMDEQGSDPNFSDVDSKLQNAEAMFAAGQSDRALSLVRPILEVLRQRHASKPANYEILNSMAYAQALAGDKDGARASLSTALQMLKPEDPLRKQVYVKANAAIVYGWIGDKDRCVEIMSPLLKIPTSVTNCVSCLRNDIDFFPMRDFPPFLALLNDPENLKPFSY